MGIKKKELINSVCGSIHGAVPHTGCLGARTIGSVHVMHLVLYFQEMFHGTGPTIQRTAGKNKIK
jgi:hypothetical protein